MKNSTNNVYLKPNHFANIQMKKYSVLFLFIFLNSCQVTETIHLNQDGTGKIEISRLREEQSYMQLMGEEYSKEEIFKDTTYVFQELIAKHYETFSRLPALEKAIFQKFNKVKVHNKKSSFDKEFRTTITQNFTTISEVADLYKTEEYADDIENNYALVAEEHYYSVSFTFDGTTFKRIVKITDAVELKKQQEEIEGLKTRFSKFKIIQPYILKYHFPRKIKSFSNLKAKISEDKKSLELQFLLSDCLQNPESTNLEVVLETNEVN
ncbi:hypothetical protein ACNQGB_14450 [Flavobacterium sp. XS1P32]|uniref:hypothetical protein n=1 Tax=Flavobacterium sp. XS1P32 TaxID=3401726 RepID=UPI003AAFAB41